MKRQDQDSIFKVETVKAPSKRKGPAPYQGELFPLSQAQFTPSYMNKVGPGDYPPDVPDMFEDLRQSQS